jgi:hypothetical protein
MRQRDRHVGGDERPVFLCGADLFGRGGPRKRRHLFIVGQSPFRLPSFLRLEGNDLARNYLMGIAAGGVALAQPTACRIAGQIVGSESAIGRLQNHPPVPLPQHDRAPVRECPARRLQSEAPGRNRALLV